MNSNKIFIAFITFIYCAGSLTVHSPARAYGISIFFKMLPKRKARGSFTPSLLNLNTITMTNFCLEKPTIETNEIKSISELTNKIYHNYTSIEEGTLLPIKSHEHTVEKYCEIFKGIKISDTSDFVTINSRGFAREEKPSQQNDNNSLYKKIVHYFFPSFQARGLPKKGGGALCAYTNIGENIIHTSCISFDYPDKLNLINFAQSFDLTCLNTVLKNIPSDKKIIQVGTSRGATALLKNELLNTSNTHPVAMVLESPLLSLQDTVNSLVKTSVWNLPLPSFLSFTIFQWLYPNYNAQEDNLKDLLPQIRNDIPIFIVHLKNDPYVSDAGLFTIVNILSKHTKNIHLLVLHDTTKKTRHGRLNIIKAYQQAVNAFYKKYNLPYSEQLAQEGEKLLTITRLNASALSSNKWILTECFSKK